jgi:hypothetical protein
MEANTATREGAQASLGPTDFREHQIWLRLLNRSGLPPAARCVGFAIAGHRNIKTGRCDPSHARLSTETGFPQRSVERYIAKLRRAGLLAVARGGRGHTSRYRLLWPCCPATQVADQTPPHDPPVSAASNDITRHPGGRQTENTPPTEDPLGSSSVGDGERKRADARKRFSRWPDDAPEGASGRRREDQPPPAAALVGEILPPLDDGRNRGGPPKGAARSPIPKAPSASNDACAAGWRELRDIWRRGHLKDDAPQQRAIDRAAFEAALKIAPAGVIIAGALAWFRAFAAADGPSYLPELHIWLAARGWERPPTAQQPQLRAARPARGMPHAATAGGSVAFALQALRGQ